MYLVYYMYIIVCTCITGLFVVYFHVALLHYMCRLIHVHTYSHTIVNDSWILFCLTYSVCSGTYYYRRKNVSDCQQQQPDEAGSDVRVHSRECAREEEMGEEHRERHVGDTR